MMKIKSIIVIIVVFLTGAGVGLFFAMPEFRNGGGKSSFHSPAQTANEWRGVRKEVQRFAIDMDTLETTLRAQPSNLAAGAYVRDKLSGKVSLEDLRELSCEVMEGYDWGSSYWTGYTKNQCEMMILDKWMKLAPLSAFEFSTEQGEKFSYSDLYESWAKHDPESAMRDLQTREEEGLDKNMISSRIFSSWSEISPDSAWRWLKGKEGAGVVNDREYASVQDFLQTVLWYHPDKMKDFAYQAKNELFSLSAEQDGRLLDDGFQNWIETNIDEARKWTNSLSKEDQEKIDQHWQRYAEMKDLSSFMEKLKAKEAAGEVVDAPSFGYEELKKKGVDGKTALEYIVNYNNGNDALCSFDKSFSYVPFLDEAVLENRAAAKELLKTMPQGERRDYLLESIIATDYSDDHPRKLQQAEGIQEESKRKKVQNSVLEKWELIDSKAAQEWRRKNRIEPINSEYDL